MLKTRISVILIASLALSACGGGGGGGDVNSAPESKYIANHSLSASYALNRTNTPLVAEKFINEILQSIAVFDGHRLVLSTPIPQFYFENGTQRTSCNYSGSINTSIQKNGGTITLEFDQCKDDINDVSSSGTIKSYIYNVNETDRTFNAAVEFIDYQERLGSRYTSASGTTVLNVSIVEHDIIIVEAETHRNVYDSDIQENFESNISYAFLYLQYPEYLALLALPTDSSGYIDFENSGTLILSGDVDLYAATITGFGDNQAKVKLHNNRYSLRYEENSGEYFSIGISASKFDDIDVFAANTPPHFTLNNNPKSFYAPNQEPAEILLDQWFFDAEFNLHEIDVNISCGPVGAQTNIGLEDPFKIKFTSDIYGLYTLNVRITDADGNFAEGPIYIKYLQDEQSGNTTGEKCQPGSSFGELEPIPSA